MDAGRKSQRPPPAWRTTTLYSHQDGKGNPPRTKVFTHSGPGQPSHAPLPPSLQNSLPTSVQSSVQGSGRNGPMSGHLESLLAGIAAPHADPPGGGGGRQQLPKGRLQYLGNIWQELQETQETRPSGVEEGPRTASRPGLDKALLKTSSNRPKGKETLSGVDGKDHRWMGDDWKMDE